jgi:cytochrome c oxidase assembly factor CtaG
MLDPKALLDWTGGPAFAWVVGAASLYWLGGRRTAHSADGSRWRTACFAALDSSIDELSEQLLWVHMVQHIMLLVVAPPLLALARPWNRMWHGLPLTFRRRTAGAVAQSPRLAPVRRAARVLQDPVVAWLAFNVTFVAWHIPAAYDATLQHPFVHALEHAMFFGTALLFWTRVIDSPPWRSPLSDVPRAVYLGLAMVVSWVLAIAFAVSTAPVYAPYAAEASRPGGLTALADQQLAAGVMWVPGSIPLTIGILFIMYRWLQPNRGGQGPRPQPAARYPGLSGEENHAATGHLD